jgi:hypothetical protein
MKKQSKNIAKIILVSSILLITILMLIAQANKTEKKQYEETTFTHQGTEININFLGEKTNKELFGEQKITDIAHPINEQGNKQGTIYNDEPNWLKFEYTKNNVKKTVLIAKEPIMNFVSFDDIARAGAAFKESEIYIEANDEYYDQNKTIIDINKNEYKIRLIDCGNSTTNPTSEWNFLIGGIHEGDIDFKNRDERLIYSFIKEPYTDKDLKIGQNGSLNWCMNSYEIENYIVNRGYFHASRFHASKSDIRTNRIYWRPVLELIEENTAEKKQITQEEKTSLINNDNSNKNQVKFLGEITNQELFENNKMADLINLTKGLDINDGKPDWLHFELNNKTLIIAKKPIKHSISYQDLLDEELVLGKRTIQDINQNNYILRLIKCGENTLDHDSEWNLLIGGVSEGDTDFKENNHQKIYATINKPYKNEELQTGIIIGGSTWCQETKQINNELYAVNRGYMTISRYHLTQIYYGESGFSYRPVLELIK